VNYRDYFEVCTHRWTVEILTALRGQPRRYTDLLHAISPPPSTKSLNEALRRLQDCGLVAHPVRRDGAVYELTTAGQALMPLLIGFLDDLRRWTDEHRRPIRPHAKQPGRSGLLYPIPGRLRVVRPGSADGVTGCSRSSNRRRRRASRRHNAD
jgi:DNA-binding HxlR family transcriptional regulator